MMNRRGRCRKKTKKKKNRVGWGRKKRLKDEGTREKGFEGETKVI
jgi:hypothetical protein